MVALRLKTLTQLLNAEVRIKQFTVLQVVAYCRISNVLHTAWFSWFKCNCCFCAFLELQHLLALRVQSTCVSLSK